MTMLLEIILWTCIFLVVYAYVGYGAILWLLVKIKRLLFGRPKLTQFPESELPAVTFMVAAWNEERFMPQKIRNCLALDYPREKLRILFVTDGSTDRTNEIIQNFPLPENARVDLHHTPLRDGKISAVNRAMKTVDDPIVIFTDANTDVNPAAVRNIVRHYTDPNVGAVAGEKRIAVGEAGDATGAGEGIYWKYESKLKEWDSELYSVVGAAGELFSVRTELFADVDPNTIIEDFVMTVGIAADGYRVRYEPEATASEGQSTDIAEELKRKKRIAAGGLQAVARLWRVLIPFPRPLLSFQYVSHRVLRWTLAPLALPIIFILNILLALQGIELYQWLLAAQVLFYVAAGLGWFLERRKLKFKALFVPYYFCVMNYAVYHGFVRIVTGKQSVVWERAKRA